MAEEKAIKDAAVAIEAEESIEEKTTVARERSEQEALVARQAAEASGKAARQAAAAEDKAKREAERARRRAEHARKECAAAAGNTGHEAEAALQAEQARIEATLKASLRRVRRAAADASRGQARAPEHGTAEALAEERAKARPREAPAARVYRGRVRLNLIRPVTARQIVQCQRLLVALPDVQVVSTGGSAAGGTQIILSLKRPLPLDEMLSGSELFGRVVDKGNCIEITMCPPGA
jgi:hypothetical protein